MFVWAISRPSSNMSHVGFTSRSPGQILETFCLLSRGTLATGFLWNLVRMFVLTISRTSLNMSHVGLKLSHKVKCSEFCHTLEATFATRFWWNLIRMFVLTISRSSLNMSHVGSKTRSPGQIFGNSCYHSKGQTGDPILMKLDQNVCLSNI